LYLGLLSTLEFNYIVDIYSLILPTAMLCLCSNFGIEIYIYIYTFIRHEDRIGLQQGLKTNRQTDKQTNKHYN